MKLETCYLLATLVAALAWVGSGWATGTEGEAHLQRLAEGEVLFRDSFEPPGGSEGWHAVSRWGGGVEAAGWVSDQGRRGGGCLTVAAGGTRVGWERKAMPAVAGAVYEVTGWLKGSLAEGGAGLGIAFATSRGEIISELHSDALSEATDWKRVSLSGAVPAGAVLVTFFCSAEGNGRALFDDITAFIVVPPRLRLVSWEFPRSVVEGEEAVARLVLVAADDVRTGPSLAAFVVSLDSQATILRRFQRLAEPGETWGKGTQKQVEMVVLAAGHRYPPGRYVLRLELRNAGWAEAEVRPEQEFEIIPKPSAASVRRLAAPIYEGPREARGGQALEFSLRTSSAVELRPGKGFAWLWRGEELWAAGAFAFAGGGAVNSGQRFGDQRFKPEDEGPRTRNQRLEAKVALELPEAIPAGEYELGVGIVGAIYEGREPQECSIARIRVRAAPRGERCAGGRPLAHGVFTDGADIPHFWWVNEQGTLFWDAEPCLPVGTIYCPAFLREYSLERGPRNEANWRVFAERVADMRARGVTDLIIVPGRPLTEVPAGTLQRVVDELEVLGFRYGIELNAGPRQGLGGYWVNSGMVLREVRPGADYTTPAVALPLAEGGEALFLALEAGREEVVEAGRVRLSEEAVPRQARDGEQSRTALAGEGRFIFRLNRWEGAAATVYFTPLVQLDAASPQQNLWEGFEGSVEEVCQLLGAVRFGCGLRFFIDPLRVGLSYGFPPLLPDSEEFREEYARWLERKFGRVGALAERWRLSGQRLASFQEASRLVPLAVIGETCFLVAASGQGLKGSLPRPLDKLGAVSNVEPQAGDGPSTLLGAVSLSNRERSRTASGDSGERWGVFRMDLAGSVWWLDWLEFRDESVAKKLDYVASRIKEVVEVPVVIGHSAAPAPYHVAWSGGRSGIDGIASRNFSGQWPVVSGSKRETRNLKLETRNSKLKTTVAGYGAARQSVKSLWCLASVAFAEGMEVPPGESVAGEGYLPKGEMAEELVEILSCGAKGIYVSCDSGDDSAAEGSRTLESEALEGLAELRRRTESARERLAGYGPPLCFWLPAVRPEEGVFSSSAEAAVSAEEIWTGKLPFLVRGRWVVPAWMVSEDCSPMILGPWGRVSGREYLPLLLHAVGQTHRPRAYIGHLPLSEGVEGLAGYFTSQFEPDSDGTLVQVLSPSPTSEVLARTPSGGVWHLLDGTLEIISKPPGPVKGAGSGAEGEGILPADLLRIFDIGAKERYYSAEEFGRELLGRR